MKLASFVVPFAAVVALSSATAFADKHAGKTLVVDTAKSKFIWSGKKKTGSGHAGEILVKEGSVTMGEKTLTGGTIVMDMKSLTVTDIPKTEDGNAKLEGHLENADFFDVEKYPTSKLVVTSSKDLGGGKHEVKGKITIKDVTQDVTMPVTVKKEGAETVATGKLTLDRTAFGVKYGSSNFFKLAADKVINNEFDLDFTIVAK